LGVRVQMGAWLLTKLPFTWMGYFVNWLNFLTLSMISCSREYFSNSSLRWHFTRVPRLKGKSEVISEIM